METNMVNFRPGKCDSIILNHWLSFFKHSKSARDDGLSRFQKRSSSHKFSKRQTIRCWSNSSVDPLQRMWNPKSIIDYHSFVLFLSFFLYKVVWLHFCDPPYQPCTTWIFMLKFHLRYQSIPTRIKRDDMKVHVGYHQRSPHNNNPVPYD